MLNATTRPRNEGHRSRRWKHRYQGMHQSKTTTRTRKALFRCYSRLKRLILLLGAKTECETTTITWKACLQGRLCLWPQRWQPEGIQWNCCASCWSLSFWRPLQYICLRSNRFRKDIHHSGNSTKNSLWSLQKTVRSPPRLWRKFKNWIIRFFHLTLRKRRWRLAWQKQ